MNSGMSANEHKIFSVSNQWLKTSFFLPIFSLFLCLSQKFKEHHITLELIVTTVDIDNFFHRILSICCISKNFSFLSCSLQGSRQTSKTRIMTPWNSWTSLKNSRMIQKLSLEIFKNKFKIFLL